MPIELIADIQPKNDGFAGLVDAYQIKAVGTLLDGCVAASNVTQHVASIDHDSLLHYLAVEHVPFASGIAADRPAAGTANRYYFATDTRVLSRDTGGARETIAAAPTAHKDDHDPNDGSDALDCAAAAEISAVVAASEGAAHSFARSDHVHAINHAITDNHIVTIDQADAATGEYAKFTANGIESKSVAEVLSDISVTSGADVTGDNTPKAHLLGAHTIDSLANLNSIITDTTLIDTTDSRLSDGRTDAAAVHDADFDAESILAADSDDTPTVRTIAEQQVVGRITGEHIKGLSVAEVLTLIGVDSGADVTGDNTPQAHKDSHDPNDGGDALDCAAAAEISAVVAAGEGEAHTFARADHIHAIVHAITNNHILTVDGTTNQPVDTDYAAWTASGLEGRDKTQMQTFMNVADGADVSTTSFAFFMA